MIVLYSGTPGSGKSLDCARTIYRWSRRGAPIICNFPINADNVRIWREKEIYYVPNSDLDPDMLVAYSREYFAGRRMKEDSILLIIDEAQLLFNARDWRSKGRERWNWFFTMHRHFGYYIILCAQYDQMLDYQIRCLIEYEIIHRKVKNIGWRGYVLSLLMLSPFSLFVKVRIWYPMNERIDSELFKSKSCYHRIYDTFELLDTASGSTDEDEDSSPIPSGVLRKYRQGKKYREELLSEAREELEEPGEEPGKELLENEEEMEEGA